MMLKALPLALLALAVLTAEAEAQGLAGRWTGVVVQTAGSAPSSQQLHASLALTGASGSLAFAPVGCGGEITFDGRQGARYVYRAYVVQNDALARRCPSGGLIYVTPDQPNGVLFRWAAPDGVSVGGELYAQSPAAAKR